MSSGNVRTYGMSPANGVALTLADLRELVEDTAGLPAAAVIRGQPAIRGQDFTNPGGMLMRGMTVEYERGPRPQAGQVDA